MTKTLTIQGEVKGVYLNEGNRPACVLLKKEGDDKGERYTTFSRTAVVDVSVGDFVEILYVETEEGYKNIMNIKVLSKKQTPQQSSEVPDSQTTLIPIDKVKGFLVSK